MLSWVTLAEAFRYAELVMMIITTILPAGFHDRPPEGIVVWVIRVTHLAQFLPRVVNHCHHHHHHCYC